MRCSSLSTTRIHTVVGDVLLTHSRRASASMIAICDTNYNKLLMQLQLTQVYRRTFLFVQLFPTDIKRCTFALDAFQLNIF